MGLPPGVVVRLYGRRDSRRAWEIRDFLSRCTAQFEWTQLDDDEQCRAALGVSIDEANLPWFVLPDGSHLENPTIADIGERLGWIRRPTLDEYDVSIYGAGPAGLSAAVYAASEGLRVIVVERAAVGGQAGTSSLIENYLGFPTGIRGLELAERARQQASAFGAEMLLLSEGVQGTFEHHRIHGRLGDGTEIVARANICATGVEWRRLGLDDEERLLGLGLYYGAGTSEAPSCAGEHVFVIGGGNSAGQAAMNLSAYAASVTMLIRGDALSATMSSYLGERILASDTITVRYGSRVSAVLGDEHLAAIELEDAGGGRETVAADRLFICIGGDPNTEWARQAGIVRDDHGYLVTGSDLDRAAIADRWSLERQPFYLETSVPGSFAVGDVRRGSIKRVASAVGEGAMAVTFVHRYLTETFGDDPITPSAAARSRTPAPRGRVPSPAGHG